MKSRILTKHDVIIDVSCVPEMMNPNHFYGNKSSQEAIDFCDLIKRMKAKSVWGWCNIAVTVSLKDLTSRVLSTV